MKINNERRKEKKSLAVSMKSILNMPLGSSKHPYFVEGSREGSDESSHMPTRLRFPCSKMRKV